MQYMDIIQRSLSYAWKHKFLWIFGFFVAVADGSGGSHINLKDLKDFDFFGRPIPLGRHFDFERIDFDPLFIASLVLALFFVWILFWFLSVLAEGSLINGISRKELNQPTGFSDCLSAGANKFFRLLGIMFIATVLVIAIIFGIIIFLVPAYIVSVPLGIILTIFLIPLLLAIILVIVCVEGWAIRFGVLYDHKFSDCIGNAWNLFKNNVGKTLGVAFSSFITQMIFSIAIILFLILLAIPFVFIGMQNLWLALIPGILLALTIFLISACYLGVFSSSVWTVGFMRLTGFMPSPAPATAGTDAQPPPPPEPDNYNI